MVKPKISVVIPAFNEEKFIGRCLASLIKQTFPEFEIIVVDNNCTDQTVEIARNYNARIVKERVQGMTPARERGFKEAKAEFIVRTDADSILPADWLENFYRIFSTFDKVAGIAGSHRLQTNAMINFMFEKYMDSIFYFTRILIGHYQFSGGNYALRKSAWEKIKIELHKDDLLVHEDMDIACHLSKVGKIEFHPQIRSVFPFRRFRKNLLYTFFEYSIRYFRTIWIHHPFFSRN